MTAASAAVLVAVVGLSAVLAVQHRANTALDAKNRDLDRANGDLRLANDRETKANADLRESNRQKDQANAALAEANVRVQARFELAREAIRSFKSGVEQDETLKEDRLKPLRDKLLGSARQFYDKLGALLEGQADATSKAVLAESYRELGDLIDKIGQKPESLAAFKKAVAIRRELAALPGTGASERVQLARALNATRAMWPGSSATTPAAWPRTRKPTPWPSHRPPARARPLPPAAPLVTRSCEPARFSKRPARPARRWRTFVGPSTSTSP